MRNGSELALVSTILEGGKERILIHPVVNLFMMIKWNNIKGLFSVFLALMMLYQVRFVSWLFI